MNALRRILLVFYSLVLLAALGGIGALAWNQDQQLDLDVEDLNIQAFIEADNAEKWVLTGIIAGIGLFALITLLIAIWPRRRPSRGALRIRQTDGGTVEVTSAAVESLLKDELESLQEIQTAKPRVSLAGGAVDTFLDVQIEPSASIAHVTKLIGATVEETLRDQVGVTAVRRPVIRISYDEMAARPVPVKRPRTPAPDLRPQHAPASQSEAPATDEAARPPEAPRFVSPNDEESPKA